MHTGLPSFAMVLDTVVKSTVLLALAWSAALILKKRSAATQHMVRAFALAALLLLPFSVLLLPAWHVKGIPEFSTPRPQASRKAVAQPAATSISFAKPSDAPATTAKHAAPPAPAAPAIAQFKSEIRVEADRKDHRASSSLISIVNLPAGSASTPIAVSLTQSATRAVPQVVNPVSYTHLTLPTILRV